MLEQDRTILQTKRQNAKKEMAKLWPLICKYKHLIKVLYSRWNNYREIFEQADRELAEENVKIVKNYKKEKDPLANLTPDQLKALINELNDRIKKED